MRGRDLHIFQFTAPADRFAWVRFHRHIGRVGFLRAGRASEAHSRPLLILNRSPPWEEHKVQQYRRKLEDRNSQGINHDVNVINGRLEQNNGGEETESKTTRIKEKVKIYNTIKTERSPIMP